MLPLVGLGSLAAASVHYVVMPHHFEEGTIYGCFFAVAATLQVVFGLLTLARPSRPLIAAGLVGNVAVIILWLITRTVGIPLGPAAGSTEAVGGLDVLATMFEIIIVLGSVSLLSRSARAATLFAAPLHVGMADLDFHRCRALSYCDHDGGAAPQLNVNHKPLAQSRAVVPAR